VSRYSNRFATTGTVPPSGTFESFTQAMAMDHQVHTYSELRQQIHDDLRIQHPEWVQPNGESPMCDSYEVRLIELLDALTQRGSNESHESGTDRQRANDAGCARKKHRRL
jgi:hypothetical protein